MSQYKTTTKLFLRLKVNEIGTRSYHALGAHFLEVESLKKSGNTGSQYKLACAPPRNLK